MLELFQICGSSRRFEFGVDRFIVVRGVAKRAERILSEKGETFSGDLHRWSN